MAFVAALIGPLIKWLLGLWIKTTPAPSAEAVATGNAMAAHIDAAVAKKTVQTTTAESQAVVDAPTTKEGVAAELDNGTF